MMQYFEWYMKSEPALWTAIAKDAAKLSKAGVTSAWLPPAYKGANGAEDVLLPEHYNFDEQEIVNHIIEGRKKGKQHHLIINAEGIGHSSSMAKRIEAATGIETRATILGHMQRGGSPTARDRVYASTMGAMAVDLLLEGAQQRVIGVRNGQYIHTDLDEALAMQKSMDEYQLSICKTLANI